MPSEEVPLSGVGWSSSLSVAEAAAIRESGFQPRGLVMGSSVYHLGVSYSPSDYARMNVGPWGGGFTGGGFGGPGIGGGPWGGGGFPGGGGFTGRGFGGGWNGPSGGGWRSTGFPGWCKYYSADDLGWGGGYTGAPGVYGLGYAPAAVCWERSVFEDGLEEAASLALQRIEAETSALGAHGVIGTRLNFHYLPEMAATVEFTAIGTAVVRPGAPPLARPFTSHLTGQDLLKLVQAGMVPVGVGVGAGSVVAEVVGWTAGSTFEVVPFGEAIENSRRLAAERLTHVAGRGGQLVLGTMASSATEMEERGRVTTTVLIGTVVRRFAEGRWASMPLPVMRLSRP